MVAYEVVKNFVVDAVYKNCTDKVSLKAQNTNTDRWISRKKDQSYNTHVELQAYLHIEMFYKYMRMLCCGKVSQC